MPSTPFSNPRIPEYTPPPQAKVPRYKNGKPKPSPHGWRSWSRKMHEAKKAKRQTTAHNDN